VLFSLSKSFTSTAVGLAIAEGKLKEDDLVLGFFQICPGAAERQPQGDARPRSADDVDWTS
jgi:CubicO group peptidase (beta-lactamase class C family)